MRFISFAESRIAIQQQAQAGKNVFVYFNNDLNVRAPNNAKLLMEMCGPAVVPPQPA